jgi:hypothetical protein
MKNAAGRDDKSVAGRNLEEAGKLSGPAIKWAGNQEAVTFLGYRPIRS